MEKGAFFTNSYIIFTTSYSGVSDLSEVHFVMAEKKNS